MRRVKLINKLIPSAAAAMLGFGATAAAQSPEADPEQDRDELQTIVLDTQAEPDETPDPNEGFEDLIFDETTQTYRLIEQDEPPEDRIEPPSEREVQEEELKRLFELYREALDNKDYLEADTLAKRVVELSIKINGLDSHDSARAITNLGIAQHNNGDYESALRNFAASIDIIERIDDNLSPALINPLRGLAATQAAIGRPDLAQLSYQRAVHVSHVNEGPHNKDQIGILESMAELDIAQGDYEEASDIQEHIYAIQARNVDPMSLEMVEALKTQADWQHRLQQYHQERVTWRQIISILESHYGKAGLELIPPLTKLATSYLFVSPAEWEYQPEVSASSGETYLRRANRIAEENPDSTWRIVEDTLLSMGDYYVLSGRPNRASNAYEEAWNLLSEGDDPEKLQARREHLESVKSLQKVYPPRYYNSEREDRGQPAPDSFETGTMAFSFTVSASGRVANLQHLETQPPQITDFDTVVARSLRRLIYRPRIVDGQMVDTPDVIYEHQFFYRPADLPALGEPEAPAESPADAPVDESGDISEEAGDSAGETDAEPAPATSPDGNDP